jgi:hypothetical protein
MRLFEVDRSQDQSNCTDRAEQGEIGAPANPLREVGADRGRQRGHQAHHHHDRRQCACRALAIVNVAHDCPAQDHSRAATQRRERAANNQRRQRPGEPAECRADEKQSKPGEQHRAPAKAIGGRAIEQLSHGDPGEKQCQHQLDSAGRGIKNRGQAWQRRHEDVQRRRREGGDEGQQNERRSAMVDHPGGMRERACFEKALRGKQRPRLLLGLMVETRARRPYTISAISSAKAPNSRASASAVSAEDRIKVSQIRSLGRNDT